MKIFYKSKIKKITIIFLVIVLLITGVGPSFLTPKVYAADTLGILLWPLSALLSTLAYVANELINALFGATVGTGTTELFISHIVYNRVDLFKVNIFDSSQMASGSTAAMATMLPTIQKWYGTTRLIAIGASLAILVYVGIKILLSTAAGDKAKYKSLLRDWVLSLVLIFTMHYIMSIILYACDALTTAFANLASFSNGDKVFTDIAKKAVSGDTDSILYAIMMWILIIETLLFVLIYSKRVIMIAFLTIIAPLAAISYSIDKIKDGQSQILDKWTKEYLYTALMMPMDALLFTIIYDTIKTNLNPPSGTTGNAIFALALVLGFVPLRGWFNEFLGTDRGSKVANAATAGAVGGMMANQMQKIGSGKNQSTKDQVNEGKTNERVGAGNSNNRGAAVQSAGNRPQLNSSASSSSGAGAGAGTSNSSSNQSYNSGSGSSSYGGGVGSADTERVPSPESSALPPADNSFNGRENILSRAKSEALGAIENKKAEIQSKGGYAGVARRMAGNTARRSFAMTAGLMATAVTGNAAVGIGATAIANNKLKGSGTALLEKGRNAAVTTAAAFSDAATSAIGVGYMAKDAIETKGTGGYSDQHYRNIDYGPSYTERMEKIDSDYSRDLSGIEGKYAGMIADFSGSDQERESYQAYLDQQKTAEIAQLDSARDEQKASVNSVVNRNLTAKQVDKMKSEGKTSGKTPAQINDEIFRTAQRKGTTQRQVASSNIEERRQKRKSNKS